MNCQEAKHIFYKYLDNELSFSEEKDLSTHLQKCGVCSREFAIAKETHYLLQKSLVPVMPPADLTERIMGAIPDDCFQPKVVGQRSASFWPRVSHWWKNIWQNWRRVAGSWQVKTAAVTLGVLAVVLVSTNLTVQETQVAKSEKPGINAGYQNPDKSEEDPGVIGPKVETPLSSERPVVLETPGKKVSQTEQSPKKGGKSSSPKSSQLKKGAVAPGGKNIIQLPQAASGQSLVESVALVSLVEPQGGVTHPVLVQGGKSLHYLTFVNGVKEEWQVALQEGAEPQKAVADLVCDKVGINSSQNVLDWLGSIEVFKEAVSVVSAWSPDKKQVALNVRYDEMEDRRFPNGLWVVDSEDTSVMQVAQVGGGTVVTWSPDLSKIAFTDENNDVYILYLRENLLLQVTNSGDGFSRLETMLWTADGKKVVLAGQKKSDSPSGIFMITLP